MKNEKTSVIANGLIWFGAAVSIAEIFTGTLIAPLGFTKGLYAILLGHLIGCTLLYGAGLIGAKTEKSSMETVKISFGEKGSILFSSLNILQLIGWTAVMIVGGAIPANYVLNLGGDWVWSLIIGALIIIWILVGLTNLKKVNIVAMGSLFILTILMSTVIFSGESNSISKETISFSLAVELSIAMPLSWLPLISDYTRAAKNKKTATLVSVITYGTISCWMYTIGMGAALFTGESSIAKIMVSAGLGLAGLVVIILSTVTTTFLDAYSAGVSCVSLSKKINEKSAAVVVCILGVLLAIFAPITRLETFLYLISSVFAPMIAILITDFFILKKDASHLRFNPTNLLIWLAGFITYRLFMAFGVETPVGISLPVMLIIGVLCLLFKGVGCNMTGSRQ